MLLPTDQCSYHPSSKKVLLLGSGDHHRNPPVNTVQKSGDQGSPGPADTPALLLFYQWLREDDGIGGGETVRAGIPGSLLHMAFLRKSCMNKTGTMTIPIDFRRA